MKLIMTIAFTALMLSPCVAATEQTAAQSEDSLICRQSNADTQRGGRLPALAVCHTARKWTQLDEQKRRFVAPNINTSAGNNGTFVP